MDKNHGEYGKMADTCRKHNIFMGAFVNNVEKALKNKDTTAIMLVRSALADYQRRARELYETT